MTVVITESTNMNFWELAGWHLRSFSTPAMTETLVIPRLQLSDGSQEPVDAEANEPIFGAHLREAARAVQRLVR